MAKREHNKCSRMPRAAMKRDKAKHNISTPSRFGVMEMTRQRVRDVAEVGRKMFVRRATERQGGGEHSHPERIELP